MDIHTHLQPSAAPAFGLPDAGEVPLSDLRFALDRNELHLVYQPVVNIESATICGFEALLRWTHLTHGPIAPAHFIPYAEANGLIEPIGAWVLRTAWQQLEAWDHAGHTGLRMSVNLAPPQLRSDGLEATLRDMLADSRVPAAQLELELTERMLTDATMATRRCLNAIKSLGVRLSIDDFGTGY